MKAQSGHCTVVRQLPADGGENLYRVKCSSEAFERNVRESELTVQSAGPAARLRGA